MTIARSTSSHSSTNEPTPAHRKPCYGLNRFLTERTPDPPVPIAAAWARSFPLTCSPFSHANAAAPPPLLNLAQGVPSHPPPPALVDRIRGESERVPHSHGYGPVFGEMELREAVAEDVNAVYRGARGAQGAVNGGGKGGGKGEVTSAEVAITAGCNLAFAVAAMTLAGPGDRIVIPTPWYFNHLMTLESLGIETIPLPTIGPTFLPDPAVFESILQRSSNLRALILVTPNNPTGAIYPPSLIHRFASICRDRGIALVLDETYRDFLLDETERDGVDGGGGGGGGGGAEGKLPARPHALFEDEVDGLKGWEWRDTLIHLFSFSKSYAIPGHRLGALIAHPSLLLSSNASTSPSFSSSSTMTYGPLAKALDNLQICPPRTDTQRAIAWAMHDVRQRDWRQEVALELRERRRAFTKAMQTPVVRDGASASVGVGAQGEKSKGGRDAKSPEELGWRIESEGNFGAYYVYVRHPFEGTPSETVAAGLAGLVGVVVLPGSFFMPSPTPSSSTTPRDAYLRISIANVKTEQLALLPARLVLLSELWEEKGAGWGLGEGS